MRQRINFHNIALFLLPLRLNVTKTRQRIPPVNVHGARAANTLAAGTTEGEGGILFGFDFDEGVEDHGAAGVEVYGVG